MPSTRHSPSGATIDAALHHRVDVAQRAVATHHRLRLVYRSFGGIRSERTVRPLGCFEDGAVWTLGVWCEDRSRLRMFRIDRIEQLQVMSETFEDEPGKTLADLRRQMNAEMTERDSSTDA